MEFLLGKFVAITHEQFFVYYFSVKKSFPSASTLTVLEKFTSFERKPSERDCIIFSRSSAVSTVDTSYFCTWLPLYLVTLIRRYLYLITFT